MSSADALKDDIRAQFRATRPDDPRRPCPTSADIVIVEVQEVIRRRRDRFVAPSERKQYVNLDVADDPAGFSPEFGRALRFRARVEWKPGKRGRSLAGKMVYWFSRGDPNNRANVFGEVRSGFGLLGPIAPRGATRVGDDGWTETVTFYLSRYGGDAFEIVATESPLCLNGISAGPYTVWRRLYFDVTEMEREKGGLFSLSDAAIARAQACFEDVFIEFVDLGDRNLASFRRSFPDFHERYRWADDHCKPDKAPQKVHICMVNRIDTWAEATVQRAEETATSVSFTSTATIDPNSDKGSWLIVANYRVQGDGQLYTLPDGAVTLDGDQEGPRHFKIDFSLTQVRPSPTNPVEVSVLYRQRPHKLGDSTNRLHCFVALGQIEQSHRDDSDVTVGETVAHEVGHQLGLAKGLPWASRVEKDHCKFDTCLMWWQAMTNVRSGPEATTILPFHHEDVSDPGCRTFVRQKDMTKSGLNAVFRFPR